MRSDLSMLKPNNSKTKYKRFALRNAEGYLDE
jgi:hypothetical protein